jgi:predicted deacylase
MLESDDSAAFPWTIIPMLASGEKRTGYLSWPDTTLAGREWPYIAVRGREPGRAVVVTAAVHGGEYPGILGALRLGRLIVPERLRGSLLILPLVNPPAFEARAAFTTPLDGRNLNRQFPGQAGGTFTQALAFRLIEDVIRPADALIDLHSGDVFETLANHTGWYRSGSEATDALSQAMAESFGVSWTVPYDRPTQPNSLTGTAALLGKATTLVEVGGNGLASDEDVLIVFQGLINALRVLGSLGGLIPPTEVRTLGTTTQYSAPMSGLWRPAVHLEQQVSPGDLLGTISNPLGEEIAQVSSRTSGMVLYYLSSLSSHEGDPLVCVVEVP